MKRILICILSSALMFVSCKKENSSKPSTTKGTQIINFKVGFATSTGPFKTNSLKVNSTNAADSLKSNITVLYYILYDSNGKAIHRKTQHSTDANFGTLADTLLTGTYSVAVIAGNGPLIGGASVGINGIPNGDDTYQYNYHSPDDDGDGNGQTTNGQWQDTFYKKFNITVGNTNTSYNVSLDRIVGMLQVNIADAIPANVNHITVTLESEYMIFDIQQNGPAKGWTNSPIKINVDVVPGSTNNKFSTYVFNTISKFTVKIRASGPAPAYHVYSDKLIPNVTCTANHVTLLTGNLFGGSPTADGFKVTYSSVWNPDPINIGF